MGTIPEDATHWDSGDWIEWHRTPTGLDNRPCIAASPDPTARLTALHVSLLRAAKGYFLLTGQHLPIYRQIALVHAALRCDVPLEGEDRNSANTGVEVLHIPPNGPDNFVEVDLSKRFATLIVVRIKDNFTCEARMIQRQALPDSKSKTHKIRWKALPHSL
jgi:hypothetical protein